MGEGDDRDAWDGLMMCDCSERLTTTPSPVRRERAGVRVLFRIEWGTSRPHPSFALLTSPFYFRLLPVFCRVCIGMQFWGRRAAGRQAPITMPGS
jgi:hypothetical protein